MGSVLMALVVMENVSVKRVFMELLVKPVKLEDMGLTVNQVILMVSNVTKNI